MDNDLLNDIFGNNIKDYGLNNYKYLNKKEYNLSHKNKDIRLKYLVKLSAPSTGKYYISGMVHIYPDINLDYLLHDYVYMSLLYGYKYIKQGNCKLSYKDKNIRLEYFVKLFI